MRSLLERLVLLAIFIGGNIVAAGVWLVLGGMWQRIIPGADSPWPYVVIGALAAIAALAFIHGAIDYIARHSLLEWRRGRRGG